MKPLSATFPSGTAPLLVRNQAEALETVVEKLNVSPEAMFLALDRLLSKRFSSIAEMRRILSIRGTRQEQDLAQRAGATFGAAEVANFLNRTRQGINEAKKRGALLAFSSPFERGDRFPVWQFDGTAVRPWVPELISHLGNGYPSLSFLLGRRTSLGGGCYLDLVAAGDQKGIERMLAVASRRGDAAAHS